MPDRPGNGGRGDWLFGGMRLMERADAAFRHLEVGMRHLADFYDATEAGDLVKQQTAAAAALRTLQDLLRAWMLNELLQAKSMHLLGPWPADDASDDATNMRAQRELHLVLDWLAEIAPLYSVDAARFDLKRLAQRQLPKTLRRDYYADPRERDAAGLLDREFAVLLTHFVAKAQQITIPVLLERLGTGTTYDAFRKWAAVVDREQRDLMDAAGTAEITRGGLTLAQAAQLSQRSRHVLLRDDPDRFPSLAGLSDEDKLRKLFTSVQRSGPASHD